MNADAPLARLQSAKWLKTAQPIFDVLGGADGQTRAVGGVVRDTLLGLLRETPDIDMATALLPEDVIARAEGAGFAAHPTGIAHGTITVVAKGIKAEVTTLRTDIETFGRHARVDFGADWAGDAARRDFTMNALYVDADGALFDPLGGLGDCLNRRVRFIGNADARIAEDRLRVFRYFRFSATHGQERFEANALAACARAAGTLDALSAERIGAEMLKLLNAPTVSLTLAAMAQAGILDADIVPGDAVPALARLEQQGVAPDAPSRAALLVLAGADVATLKRLWRLSNALVHEVECLARGAQLAMAGAFAELAYRFADQKGKALHIAAALQDWPETQLKTAAAQLARFTPGDFPVTGHDLIAAGVPKGRALGAALARLEQFWISSEFALSRTDLLALVAQD